MFLGIILGCSKNSNILHQNYFCGVWRLNRRPGADNFWLKLGELCLRDVEPKWAHPPKMGKSEILMTPEQDPKTSNLFLE